MKKFILSGGQTSDPDYSNIDINKLTRQYDAFHLSNKDLDRFKETNYASTYGEITRNGMKELLKGFNTKDKVFIDLGSGGGKSVVYAVLDNNFKYGVGIEFSKERHEKAKKLLQKLPNEISKKIKFIYGDLFNAKLNKVDFVFISNLCFSEDVNDRLANKLAKEAKPGTIILCSKKLDNPKLKLIETRNVEMTWSSKSTIYLYEKI